MTISGITVFDERSSGVRLEPRAAQVPRPAAVRAVGLLAPFAGAFADRFGIKKLMLRSVLLAACFVAYSQLASLPMLYAIHVTIALVRARGAGAERAPRLALVRGQRGRRSASRSSAPAWRDPPPPLGRYLIAA